MTNILLTITALLALSGMLATMVAFRRYRRRQAEVLEGLQDTCRRLRQLEQDVGALCSASAGAGDHVLRVEQQVQRIVERQNMLELRSSSAPSYSQASQLIDRGADIDQLVGSCGLTRGEAELLLMMQRGAA